MNCKEIFADLIDQARRAQSASTPVREHMADCSACRDRWDAERHLTAHFQTIRVQTSGLQPSAFQRARLMQEFSKQRRGPAVPRWAWSLAAAAAILLAVFIGHDAGLRSRHTAAPAVMSPAIPAHAIPVDNSIMYEVSTDASALSTDDYFEVPYTPPLAQGELVRVVHTQVHPEELASLGLAVDPAWQDNLAVDMVVGEDGLPRAVRISETQF